MANIDEIKIDKEFSNLCPGLTDVELRQLEANILADGRFTDPIITWHGLILDGHNRKDVFDHLPDDSTIQPPEIIELDLPSRPHAMLWITWHQLGRRNFNTKDAGHARSVAVKLLKQIEAESKEQPILPEAPPPEVSRHNVAKPPPSGGRPRSAESRVAEQSRVTTRTVQRNVKLDEAIDKIGSLNSKAGADLRSRALKVSDKDVIAVGKLSVLAIGKAVVNWRKGLKWDDDGEPPETPVPADTLPMFADLTKAYGVSSRALDKIAVARGGQGSKHGACMASLDEFVKNVKAYRKGGK